MMLVEEETLLQKSDSTGQYCLHVERQAGNRDAIQVFYQRCSNPLVDWRGPVAQHLLASDAMPLTLRRSGNYFCDKTFVWRLLLAATTVQSSLDQLEARLGKILKQRGSRRALASADELRV